MKILIIVKFALRLFFTNKIKVFGSLMLHTTIYRNYSNMLSLWEDYGIKRFIIMCWKHAEKTFLFFLVKTKPVCLTTKHALNFCVVNTWNCLIENQHPSFLKKIGLFKMFSLFRNLLLRSQFAHYINYICVHPSLNPILQKSNK